MEATGLRAQEYAQRQRDYYAGKAHGGMRGYLAIDYLILATTFAVTVVGLTVANSSKVLGILGAIGTLLAAIRALTRAKDDWIRCGIAAGKIELEISAYSNSVPPYDTEQRDGQLVAAVNRIKTDEFNAWATTMRDPTS